MLLEHLGETRGRAHADGGDRNGHRRSRAAHQRPRRQRHALRRSPHAVLRAASRPTLWRAPRLDRSIGDLDTDERHRRMKRLFLARLHRRRRAGGAWPSACPDKNVMYWQAFPPGGESDLSARHQQVVLKKKCPAIDTIIQYKAGAGGALMWSADQHAAGRRREHRRHQPAAHRAPADRGRGAVQDRRRDAGVLVPLHARCAGGARAEPASRPSPTSSRRPRTTPGKLNLGGSGLQLGQPRGARAHERGLRHQDHLRAVQGHRRHDDGGARRPDRRRA